MVDAPPGPLDGIRVLDASRGVAGPMAAMYLADFGADVVKVEPPGGDPARSEPGFAIWNRNKRGIVIDRDAAADREQLATLLRGADLCLFSDTLDVLRAQGLDPETLAASNGRLIFLHMPPFLANHTPWAGGAESSALIGAATGIAMGQISFELGPVDSIYPHVLYSQAIWGATTAVAALIERDRSGAGQTVTVGGLHGMLQAMTGSTHIPGAVLEHRPGGPGGTVPFYRTYEGSDGAWLFLASLTPAFFFRVFEALELTHVLADERLNGEPLSMALPENAPWVIEILRDTFKQRPRDAWRTTLTEIGCPSGPVDDRDDWLDHPQIRAIGMRAEVEDPERGHVVMPGLPLQMGATPASIRRPAPTLGQHDADPPAWPAQAGAPASPPRSAGPLTGAGTVKSIRVLDLGAIIAGTYSGSLLAELGAEVIKVEPLSGDNLRQFAPTFPGFNKGKRGIAIDLRSEAGHAVFLDLVRNADIVIDNYRQGVLERLKIDYASLRAVNPDIVSISLTGFGEGGTMDGDPGFDPVLQAHSGMMRAQGGDSEPVFFTLPVNDVSSAVTLALGAVLAIFHRQRGGAGQRIWTSLAGQSCMMQSGELVRFQGRVPAHRGGRDFRGPTALDRYYQTADGWLRLQALRPGIDRAAAITALRAAALLPPDSPDDDAALASALTAALAPMNADDAVATLAAQDLAAMRARTIYDLPNDPLFEGAEAMHLIVPEFRPASGAEPFYTMGRYARFSRTERADVLTAPGLGEHTLEVLAEIGRDDAASADLLASGAVAAGDPFVMPPVV